MNNIKSIDASVGSYQIKAKAPLLVENSVNELSKKFLKTVALVPISRKKLKE